MLLASALFALFMVGFWLYCLTDAILTPAAECRGLPKAAWIAVITVTFIGGAIAWLIVREPAHTLSVLPTADRDDGYFRPGRWTRADDAVARHPAGRPRVTGAVRAAPLGPDDDPEFLRVLDRRISGSWQAGEEV
jgi:hypothetical protein